MSTAGASRSLAAIGAAGLFAMAGASAAPQDSHRGLDHPAAKIVQRYLALDTDGAQFSAAGWRKLAALFVDPGPRTPGKVQVYRDAFVMGVDPAATGPAEVWLEGIVDGEYDPATGLYATHDVGPMKWRGTVRVVHDGAVWRIEGPVPRGGVTYTAVLRHATALRDTTSDPRIRRRAALAVRALTDRL